MISIEATGSDGKVFGFYADGNVLVRDDRETVQNVRDTLRKSLEFVDRWLSSSRSETSSACIPSKV
jgi:hypothetical protein